MGGRIKGTGGYICGEGEWVIKWGEGKGGIIVWGGYTVGRSPSVIARSAQ